MVDSSGEPVKVVLVDDHNIVRHAIKTILKSSGEFEVVAEAGDADTAIALVEEKSPGFLILDIGLPGKSGIEAIYEIREKKLPVSIVVLTMYEDEVKVRHAISAGANGYALKNSSPKEFIAALKAVMSGEISLPDQFSHLRPELEKLGPTTSAAKVKDPLFKLSKREREVFYLLADGMPNRVIAKKLFISPRTVETHRARVIKKLGFNSTADLIRYAIRNNLLSL